MKAAIPHVMKGADKKELEPVTPSSTVTLNPPSATRSRNLPAGGASPEISRSSTRPSPISPRTTAAPHPAKSGPRAPPRRPPARPRTAS